MTLEDEVARARLLRLKVISIDKGMIAFSSEFMAHMQQTCKTNLAFSDEVLKTGITAYLLKTYLGKRLTEDIDLEMLTKYVEKLRDVMMPESKPNNRN